jgi:GNAT superfamily N-acetyltransferase
MNYLMKKYKLEDEKALLNFYEQMHEESNSNCSRIVWEFLRNAPCFEMFQLDKIGIWYESNKIVTVMRLLSPWLGSVVVDNRSTSEDLLNEVIHYAEETFSAIKDSNKYLVVYVSEKEGSLKNVLLRHDYEQIPVEGGTLEFSLNKVIPQLSLPEGFEVKTLSEVYDFDKLSKLTWEGFNYKGSVPKIDDDVYLPIKHAWSNYNRDICSVVIAPDGSYASFCGFWYENKTQTGYLEPMVTAREYRHLGLGRACVYNSLKLLQSYGCKKVFVDPDEKPYNYYCSIGFEKQSCGHYFKKVLD